MYLHFAVYFMQLLKLYFDCKLTSILTGKRKFISKTIKYIYDSIIHYNITRKEMVFVSSKFL